MPDKKNSPARPIKRVFGHDPKPALARPLIRAVPPGAPKKTPAPAPPKKTAAPAPAPAVTPATPNAAK